MGITFKRYQKKKQLDINQDFLRRILTTHPISRSANPRRSWGRRDLCTETKITNREFSMAFGTLFRHTLGLPYANGFVHSVTSSLGVYSRLIFGFRAMRYVWIKGLFFMGAGEDCHGAPHSCLRVQ